MITSLSELSILALVVVLVFVAALCAALAFGRGATDYFGHYKKTFTSGAKQELSEMFIFMDTTRLFFLNVLILILVPIGLHFLFQLWVITVSSFVVLLIIPGVLWRRMRTKRLSKFEEQLPDVFMMLSSSL